MVTKHREHIDKSDAGIFMTKPFEKTSEGYLKGRAIVTNTGVFIYKDDDGNTIRELQLPEEVFNPTSLDSLKLKPITNDHPKSRSVDSSNIKEVQVGTVGDDPSSYVTDISNPWPDGTDGYHVAVGILITDQEAIQDVEAGKRALSCGYHCDLEQAEPGAVWCGQPYDYIQREINYNHIAIVDRARAGDAARIRLDSAENILIQEEVHQMGETLKNVTLDGVEYKAEAKVLETMNAHKNDAVSLRTKVDGLTTTISKVEGERDALKDKVDSLTKENDTLKENRIDESEINKRVKSLLGVRIVADKFEVEVNDEMSEMDIMKATIMKRFPNATLDGKNDVYIQARFDSMLEMMEDEAENDADNRQVNTPDLGENTDSADARREAMIKDMQSNWKKALEGKE